MSMDRCTKCGDVVDTDSDCNFYDFDYTTVEGYGGHCCSCRDEIYKVLDDSKKEAHERRIYG